YSILSLLNHYYFKTYALDLGVYTNALYDYIHFQWNDSCVFKENAENLLADHFDLYLMIFSPLCLVFKTYTLLIVQVISVLAGGIGIYKYFTVVNNKLALYATVYFYLFYGIYTALAFDYHSNVVAAMIVPWFFYFFKQKKYAASSIAFVFILISKENISLWIAFICLGLLFEFRKDKISIRYLFIFFSITVMYFIFVVEVIMPGLSRNGIYPHFNYSHIGNSPSEALKYLIIHPSETIKTLFVNHTNNPAGNYVKAEMHLLVLFSGLYMLFFKPYYLIMLIPIYFQKLFNNNISMWGINGQYSIEFIPILTIGAFSVLNEFKNMKRAKITAIVVLTGCLISTIRVMDHTVFINTDTDRIRIYKADHYKGKYNADLVHEQLNNIPETAIVSAQYPFVPHLALRDNIYQFPIIKDAEYIVYSLKENTYPISRKEFNSKTDALLISGEWLIHFNNEDIVILKRKNVQMSH
ncbi:MAG TPA: DUF2079 domain-containing protein, partial [Bacteroidia bacterium]|nr:DUF2079 domain-containing protein [Bacteroidia bacterium]